MSTIESLFGLVSKTGASLIEAGAYRSRWARPENPDCEDNSTMKIEVFEMERMQSTWENVVDFDLSESGVLPVSLRELVRDGLRSGVGSGHPAELQPVQRHPGAERGVGADLSRHDPTTSRSPTGPRRPTSWCPLSLLQEDDGFALEVPNYMQLWGVPRSMGAEVSKFHLRPEAGWEPDWAEFERAVNPQTRLVYVSNPNNPTGSVLSTEAPWNGS